MKQIILFLKLKMFCFLHEIKVVLNVLSHHAIKKIVSQDLNSGFFPGLFRGSIFGEKIQWDII